MFFPPYWKNENRRSPIFIRKWVTFQSNKSCSCTANIPIWFVYMVCYVVMCIEVCHLILADFHRSFCVNVRIRSSINLYLWRYDTSIRLKYSTIYSHSSTARHMRKLIIYNVTLLHFKWHEPFCLVYSLTSAGKSPHAMVIQKIPFVWKNPNAEC